MMEVSRLLAAVEALRPAGAAAGADLDRRHQTDGGMDRIKGGDAESLGGTDDIDQPICSGYITGNKEVIHEQFPKACPSQLSLPPG